MSNPQPGQMLGPYQIIKQVGKGGMATVYKAYHAAMDRYVAIKVLPHEFMHNELFLSRFRQEVRLIAKLEHKHILPVHDYGESGGLPFLVMRFLDSGTLKDRIEAGPFSLAEIDRCFTQLAEALAYAHNKGVIHRDIKPSNALLDETGDIFLTDFGIAKIVESTVQLTITGAITGTPAYMSPEQGQGLKVDHRTDIYSLGVVLYEMVTGRVPFEAETPMAVIFKKVQEPLPPPSIFKPDIDPGIEALLLKALARDPNERFASITEFLAAWRYAVETFSRHPAVPIFSDANTVAEQNKQSTPPDKEPLQEPLQVAPTVEEIPPPSHIPQQPVSISEEMQPAQAHPVYSSRQPSIRPEEVPEPQKSAPSISWKWVLLVAGIGGLLVIVVLGIIVGGSLLSTLGSVSADSASTKTFLAFMIEKTTIAQQAISLTGQPVTRTVPAQPIQASISSPTKQSTSFPVSTPITDPKDVRGWGQVRVITSNVGSINVAIAKIAFSPDGKTIASGTEDVSLWDVQSGKLLETVHEGFGSSLMAFSPDGKYLATGGFDYLDTGYVGKITFWDTGSWGMVKEMWGHTGEVEAMAFSPDSSLLASGGGDYNFTNKGEVILWQIPGGKKQCTINAYTHIASVAISPDGNVLAAATDPGSVYSPAVGKIYLWDLHKCTQLRILEPERGAYNIAFSIDGTLASASKEITLWDINNGEQLGTRPGFKLIAISPDGKVLASLGESSKQLILVDVQSGEILRTLEGHTEEVNTIAFSPDGNLLASAGDDHMIILWGATGK